MQKSFALSLAFSIEIAVIRSDVEILSSLNAVETKMFDFIMTAVFVMAALLLLVTTLRDWRATKRTAYVMPTLAFVLAAILFIDDPVMMGMPWQAGGTCQAFETTGLRI